MNLDRLYSILNDATMEFRKGEVEEVRQAGSLEVHDIYLMPHESEALPNVEKIDVVFMIVGVNKEKAELHRNELIKILKTYPEPERFAGGPSYIEVGAAIGDQGSALRLFALGKVLGLWDIITPALFGMTGEEARKAAGMGYVMITGFDLTRRERPTNT